MTGATQMTDTQMTRYLVRFKCGGQNQISRQEYAAMLIPNGTPVRWRQVNCDGTVKREGTGILLYTWMCQDTICAQIAVDNDKEIGVLLFDGARVWRLKDCSQLAFIGGGI